MHDPFDIFEQFGFGRRRHQESQKAPAMVIRLRVSLEQLHFGELLHATYTRPVQCINSDSCFVTKNDCEGPGLRIVTQQMGPQFIVQNQIQDPSCVDRKKAWSTNCKMCPNGPTELEPVYLTPFVEAGMKNGDKIEFLGVGEQKLAHEPGDVYFIVVELPHDRFTRVGDDLHTEMQITVLDALVGFNKTFEHFDKKQVQVSQEGVTPDGQVLTVTGKGMPITRKPGKYGDLFVTIRVQYPTSLDKDQKEAVSKVLSKVTSWKVKDQIMID